MWNRCRGGVEGDEALINPERQPLVSQAATIGSPTDIAIASATTGIQVKICLAQVRSERGNIQRNIDHHRTVLLAVEPGSADLVVFPELSLSNYDPDIAGAVALAPDDCRLDVFRRFADETGTAVALGAPLKTSARPLIAMLVFTPGGDTHVIGKRHLHADELPHFSRSEAGIGILDMRTRIGVAICYEISVAEHAEAALAGGAALYLATVAKTAGGVAEARATLSRTARQYRVPVLMVNSVGTCEGKSAGGGSMVIDHLGSVTARLDSSTEGLLIYDSEARTAAAV